MAGRCLAALTEREVQILRLVADGRTNTAVAHALEVSPARVAAMVIVAAGSGFVPRVWSRSGLKESKHGEHAAATVWRFGDA